MVPFFWRTRPVLRSKVLSGAGLAAYRSGQRSRSAYHRRVLDSPGRGGVAHQEMILPNDLAHQRLMGWAYDRARLWNQVQQHEQGDTPRLARMWLMHLPSALNSAERRDLALTYAREIADQYRCAVDVGVLEPPPGSQRKVYRLHMMTTVREVRPDGFGALISLEVPALQRPSPGCAHSFQEQCESLRRRWAELMNVHLERAGVPERVGYRTPEGGVTAPKLPEYQEQDRRFEDDHAVREELHNDTEALALVRAKGKQRMREWRAANRERNAQNQREWARKNPERIRAKSKRYYVAHAQEIAERKKEKYHANVEAARSKVRASYHRCALRRRLLKLETTAVHDDGTARAQGFELIVKALREDDRKPDRDSEPRKPDVNKGALADERNLLTQEPATEPATEEGSSRSLPEEPRTQQQGLHKQAQGPAPGNSGKENDSEEAAESGSAVDYDIDCGD